MLDELFGSVPARIIDSTFNFFCLLKLEASVGCTFLCRLNGFNKSLKCFVVSAERAVGDGERMLDVLQRWGQHRGEVRFFLRHNRAPNRESGKLFTDHSI